MIVGLVNDRLEALVPVRLRNSAGNENELEAPVNTGFTGSLAVPKSIAVSLGLPQFAIEEFTLADGSTGTYDVYIGEIAWDGSFRHILVSTIGDEVLVGVSLLAGYELRMEVKAGGIVEIRELP